MKEALKEKGLDGSLLFESVDKARAAAKAVTSLGRMVAHNHDSGTSSEHYENVKLVFVESASGVRCYAT